MKRINLYQAEFRPPRIVLPARTIALGAAVFTLGLIALYVWESWQLAELRRQVVQIVQRADAVTRQVGASAPGAQREIPGANQEAETLEARAQVLRQAQEVIASGALGAETGYSAQFRALSRALGNTASSGAWLTRISLYESGHAMDLQGRALDGADAAQLIGNLRREPLFVGLSFAGLKIGPPVSGSAPDASPVGGNVVSEAQPAVAPRFLLFTLNARPLEPSPDMSALSRGAKP